MRSTPPAPGLRGINVEIVVEGMVESTSGSSAEEQRGIMRCPHCTATLLRCSAIGRSSGHMDRVLAHHHSKLCISASEMTTAAENKLHVLLLNGDSSPKTCASWPKEEPPLIFAARHGLHELVSRMIESGCFFSACINHIAPSGHSALHLAAARDDADMVASLLAARADPGVVTQDSNACGSDSGGMLPLHCAAAAGASRAARVLLDAHPEAAATPDWDGALPARSALIGRHVAFAQILVDAAAASPLSSTVNASGCSECDASGCNSSTNSAFGPHNESEHAERAAEREELINEVRAELASVASSGACSHALFASSAALKQLGVHEREKARLWIGNQPLMNECHLWRSLWSADECAWLLADVEDAAAWHGWHGARHRHYATEDLPLWRAPKAAGWVRAQVADRILPRMARAFGLASAADLRLHECFIVRYEPAGQPSLAVHRDETLLSFNVDLGGSFDGGGTSFAQPVRVNEWRGRHGEVTAREVPQTQTAVCGACGDCLMHCGQLLHGGGAVTAGTRTILVGFVGEVMRSREQHEERAGEMMMMQAGVLR